MDVGRAALRLHFLQSLPALPATIIIEHLNQQGQTMNKTIQFPDHFLWGAATSAYQIEGSPLADGAGASIWQRFVAHARHDARRRHRRRRLRPLPALRGRRRADEADRPAGLPLQHLVEPGAAAGHAARSTSKGLDFYDRLVDALLANGIEPMVTLFHWDLPAALDDRGGWLNRDIADWFADYARVMFRKLDDRVKSWATLNEPWVVSDGGYLHGALAPGHRNKYEAPIAAHNLLRAHGAAVKAYREEGKHEIGLVVNLEPKYPASAEPADLARGGARPRLHERASSSTRCSSAAIRTR